MCTCFLALCVHPGAPITEDGFNNQVNSVILPSTPVSSPSAMLVPGKHQGSGNLRVVTTTELLWVSQAKCQGVVCGSELLYPMQGHSVLTNMLASSRLA